MSGRFVNGAWVETDGYEFVGVPNTDTHTRPIPTENYWNTAVTTLMTDHAVKCNIIKQYETMSFFQRLKFLITGVIHQ